MKLLKKLALVSAVLLLAAADSHARPRLFRRTCVSPAPARVTTAAPVYDTIPAPVVPVPVIPPQGGRVLMPAVGLLTPPARVVQAVGGCPGGVCGAR